MNTEWANIYWLLETQDNGTEYKEQLVADMVIAAEVPSLFTLRQKVEPEIFEIKHYKIFRHKVHTKGKWYILGFSEDRMSEVRHRYNLLQAAACYQTSSKTESNVSKFQDLSIYKNGATYEIIGTYMGFDFEWSILGEGELDAFLYDCHHAPPIEDLEDGDEHDLKMHIDTFIYYTEAFDSDSFDYIRNL